MTEEGNAQTAYQGTSAQHTQGAGTSEVHWSESSETKRLMNTLEQLEAMAGSGNVQLTEPSVKPSVADKVLAEENTRLKKANKEALGRLDSLISHISAKVES